MAQARGGDAPASARELLTVLDSDAPALSEAYCREELPIHLVHVATAAGVPTDRRVGALRRLRPLLRGLRDDESSWRLTFAALYAALASSGVDVCRALLGLALSPPRTSATCAALRAARSLLEPGRSSEALLLVRRRDL